MGWASGTVGSVAPGFSVTGLSRTTHSINFFSFFGPSGAATHRAGALAGCGAEPREAIFGDFKIINCEDARCTARGAKTPKSEKENGPTRPSIKAAYGGGAGALDHKTADHLLAAPSVVGPRVR